MWQLAEQTLDSRLLIGSSLYPSPRIMQAAIRASGIAFDREESNVGVLCAAAPVFGPDGAVRGAMSVSGFNRRAAPRMAPAVQTAALALTRELNRISVLTGPQ